MIFTANLSTTTHLAALVVRWLLYVNCYITPNQHQIQWEDHDGSTVFPQSDTTATIFFSRLKLAAIIRGWRQKLS